MDEEEIEDALKSLREDGKIQEIRDFDKGERKFGLTEEGEGFAKGMIAHDDEAALFTFSVMFNRKQEQGLIDDENDAFREILSIAETFQNQFERNLLRLLVNNSEKIEGIKLSDDIPEELMKQYDP